jgi:hypothetical protein
MNPAYVSTIKQREDVRKQYLDTLRIQIANNTLLANANEYYDKTNEVLLQPTDTRNVEDKLNDIENLKIFIRNALSTVVKNASSLLQELNDNEIQYVAQNINRVIDTIKTKYAVGIPANAIKPLLQNLMGQDTIYNDFRTFANGYFKPELNEDYEESVSSISNDDTTYLRKAFGYSTPSRPRSVSTDETTMFYSPLLTPTSSIVETKPMNYSASKKPTNFSRMKIADQMEYMNRRNIPIEIRQNSQKASNLEAYTDWFENNNVSISGRGLMKTKIKVSPENIDTTKSIEPVKSYIPFGRYVLNRYKLDDNILMLKRSKGGSIPSIPTTRISTHLTKTLQYFIDTQLPPNYDMISHLSLEDKELLHRIAKQSRLLEKLNAPRPNLDKEEQENHRFEVLKGEIHAGNDSKEVIKEFKLLLLKFIHKDKLPKRQANEILVDLITMGF